MDLALILAQDRARRRVAQGMAQATAGGYAFTANGHSFVLPITAQHVSLVVSALFYAQQADQAVRIPHATGVESVALSEGKPICEGFGAVAAPIVETDYRLQLAINSAASVEEADAINWPNP